MAHLAEAFASFFEKKVLYISGWRTALNTAGPVRHRCTEESRRSLDIKISMKLVLCRHPWICSSKEHSSRGQ